MKKINIICLFLSVAMASGCYKDTGNYDYTDINRIEIKFEKSYYNVTQGDVLELTPTYPDFVTNNAGNYEFTWFLNDETKPEWNTMTFKSQMNEAMDRSDLVIEVKDKKTDVVYMNKTSVTVTGVYTNDDSWMILSDDGGKSRLSFLSVTEIVDQKSEKQPEGSDQYYYEKERFIPNVFTGELGNGPIALQEHWRESIDYGYTDNVVGNVCVFQKRGAVDLEGSGFTKEIDMKDAFVGKKYPADNTVLYPGSFLQFTDIVCDQDGKLYSRLKLSQTVYNSEYFLQVPLKVSGEKEALEQCIVCRGFYARNRIGNQVVYDGKNKRLLYLKDGSDDYYAPTEGAARIVPIEVSKDLEAGDVVKLGDHSGYDLLHISECAATGKGSGNYGFFEVLKNIENNKTYIQKFVVSKDYYSEPVIATIEKFEITGLPDTPVVCAFPTYRPTEYAFFAVGQDLYMVDLVNKSGAELYYHFNSKITAMDYGSGGNVHLAVGLEDGSFFVLGAVGAKNIKDEHKLIYQSPEKVGKIVDIKFKNNSMWNY